MAEDIIGRRFNKLLVLSWAEPKLRKDGSTMKRVKCLCDCGNTTATIPAELTRGHVKSCGCARWSPVKQVDLTGQKIGRLTVIEEDRTRLRNPHGERFWVCRCDCGKVKTIRQSALRKANGTRSCGCLRRPPNSALPDLTGNRYGLLTVLGKGEQLPGSNRPYGQRWDCVCDCGNRKTVITKDLRSGHTRSCGCLKGNMRPGKRFGKLTLVSPVAGIRAMPYWKCRCDCGRELTLSVDTLFRASGVCCECRDTPKPKTDLTGKVIGKLTVLMEVDPVAGSTGARCRRWLCRCGCGRETVVGEHNLVRRITRSCGCLRKDKAIARRRAGQ